MYVRQVDATNNTEVCAIVSFSMRAILELCPAARQAPTKVPNFEFSRIRSMYLRSMSTPDYRFLIAVTDDETICGHVIACAKTDVTNTRYGRFYTLYVDPAWRRHGVSDLLYKEAIRWLRSRGVVRIGEYGNGFI